MLVPQKIFAGNLLKRLKNPFEAFHRKAFKAFKRKHPNNASMHFQYDDTQ